MFDQEYNQIINSLKGPHSAQSWLIVGRKGIGKKDFAQRLAHNVTHNTHSYNPNVKWIECDLTETAKKEIQKALLAGEQVEEKEWAQKTEITVDDIREGCRFLSLKSDARKILIINLADEMNENAQNALLKTLEEPYPNTLILLLCENIGHLLPTILSRCQKLTLNPPTKSDFQTDLKCKYPSLDQDQLDLLSFLADNSIGIAEEILNLNALDIYNDMITLLKAPDLDVTLLLNLASTLSSNQDLFSLGRQFLLRWLEDYSKQLSLIDLEKAHEMTLLYEQIQTTFTEIDSLNLDKKQALISLIHKIREVL